MSPATAAGVVVACWFAAQLVVDAVVDLRRDHPANVPGGASAASAAPRAAPAPSAPPIGPQKPTQPLGPKRPYRTTRHALRKAQP